MNQKEYLKHDGFALSELVKNKEVSAKELVEVSFQQLENVQPDLNIVTHHRKEKALQEADAIQDVSAPFAGVPILMKNISQAVKGEKLTAGTILMKDNVTNYDSNFVKKFREAGFIFTGHTNTPEFALKNISEPRFYGPTLNPWNHDYSSGGSSGGASAAVASGVVPIAGASDGGGSIRIPASFTSLVGLKPTRGRTPVGPGVGRQWQGASIDFVLTRSVRDAALMLDCTQTVQAEAAFQTPLYPRSFFNDLNKPVGKLKIGFTTESPVGTPVSEAAKEAVLKTVRYLEQAGHEVDEVDQIVDGKQIMRNYFLMNSGEMSTVIRQLEQAMGRKITGEDLEIESWLLNEAGKSVSAMEFSESLSSWDIAAYEMKVFHDTYDLYLTPATAFPAPKIGELTKNEKYRDDMLKATDSETKQQIIWDMFLPSLTYTPFTQLANLTGQPAISLPVHLSKEGLPIGAQFIASKGREDLLLQLATQIEQSEIWIGLKGNPYFK